MRLAPTIALVAALGFAAGASAQPAQPASEKTPLPAAGVAEKPKSNPEADAALAMAIRMQKEKDERIARYACAAGDTSKCAEGEVQAVNAPTTPRTPSP